jgi:hypothetical protein
MEIPSFSCGPDWWKGVFRAVQEVVSHTRDWVQTRLAAPPHHHLHVAAPVRGLRMRVVVQVVLEQRAVGGDAAAAPPQGRTLLHFSP